MIRLSRKPLAAALLCLSASPLFGQELDWTALDAETLQHFQAMVRIDTADPPGREIDLTNYITGVLDAEGIEYVQHAYGRLPAENKPALAEWLGNKDALPKAVRAYLPEAAPAAPATQATPAPVAMPRSNAGAVTQAPPQASAFTAEAISRMTPAEFKANRDAIMATLTAR